MTEMTNIEAAAFVQTNVLFSVEVMEVLLVNKARLKALVDSGKLKPVKELNRERLFLLADVEALKQEMLLDSRTNLYKALCEPGVTATCKKCNIRQKEFTSKEAAAEWVCVSCKKSEKENVKHG